MSRIWTLLRRLARRAWLLRYAFPITPLGICVAALGVGVSYYLGTREVDYVVRAGGLVAAFVVALTTLLTLLASLRVWLHVRRLSGGVDLFLDSGLTASSGVRVPSLSRWPLVQLRVIWEEPHEVEVSLKRRASGKAEELVTPRLRGDTTRVKRRFLVEDIFGFSRLGIPLLRVDERLRISPARAQVTAHVITRFLGGDALSHPSGPQAGELLEMRRYTYGDPLRHILWKVFARSRKLLVRTPERAITPRPSAVGYLVCGNGDEPAAGAARFFVEEGMLGRDFLFCADGSTTPTGDPQTAIDQIITSSRHHGHGAQGLDDFLGKLAAPQLNACVLFVPPIPGPWLGRVEALCRHIPGARVITAVDESLVLDGAGWFRRFLFDTGSDHLRTSKQLAATVSRLSACGFEVNVLHRPTGEFMGAAQIASLKGTRT